jgi:hypothetical protein
LVENAGVAPEIGGLHGSDVSHKAHWASIRCWAVHALGQRATRHQAGQEREDLVDFSKMASTRLKRVGNLQGSAGS